MLRQRVLTAIILFPLALAAILLPPTGLFAVFAGIAFLGASWEWSQLAGERSTAARYATLVVVAAIFVLLWLVRGGLIWPVVVALGVLWWLACCLWLRHFAFAAAPSRENMAIKLATGALVIVPAWVAMVVIHGGAQGPWWTLLALMIVWAADTGAYFSGRFFGRRKLAPQISPGKTWAGVYGAVVAGALLAGIGGWLLDVRGASLAGLIVLGVLVVAASVVGDLFESLMKRHAAVKDSGTLFPGHGGLLDRMDSVFAALPVFAAGKLLLGL